MLRNVQIAARDYNGYVVGTFNDGNSAKTSRSRYPLRPWMCGEHLAPPPALPLSSLNAAVFKEPIFHVLLGPTVVR